MLGNGSEWNTGAHFAPQPTPASGAGALGLRGVTQELLDEVENADGEEEDHGLYCICQKQSYGEMVGCDDDGCEYQWVRALRLECDAVSDPRTQFHLPCLGMATAPAGTWYCDSCMAKRQKNKGGRGGKRKAPSRVKNDR